jgi:Ca-activated chloride channel homolog
VIASLLDLDWRAPWWGLLALQPVLFWWLARRRRQRLDRYADVHLRPWAVAAASASPGAFRRDFANTLGWLLLAAAAAGPRLAESPAPGPDNSEAKRHEMTVMVVLDISASMAATDIAPARLARARLELADWLARLHGERVGIVIYAGEAGLLLPPSDDTTLVRRALDLVEPGLIEKPGTRLAAALDLAATQLQYESRRARAVLLVTDADADSLAGELGVSARAAADRLAKARIPLFVLGVGTETGGPIPLPDGGFAERDSVQVQSRMASDAYVDLVRATGGRFVSVADGDADWQALHDAGIARLPGDRPPSGQARAWMELYPWLLAPAIVLLMFAALPSSLSRKAWENTELGSLALFVLSLALLAPSLSPTDVHAAELTAQAAYRAGQYAQAQTLYARQGGYTGQLGAGASAWRLNDYRAAAGHFNAALLLARTPKERADALYNLGNAHYGLGRWQTAIEAFQAVLLDRPGDTRAMANLAQSRVRLSKESTRDPFKSDLRGRRGKLAEGVVNLDWDQERAVQDLAPDPAAAMVGGKSANGARLDSPLGETSGVAADHRRLASGLKKLDLLGDRPGSLFKGMLRQDRIAAPEAGGEAW